MCGSVAGSYPESLFFCPGVAVFVPYFLKGDAFTTPTPCAVKHPAVITNTIIIVVLIKACWATKTERQGVSKAKGLVLDGGGGDGSVGGGGDGTWFMF